MKLPRATRPNDFTERPALRWSPLIWISNRAGVSAVRAALCGGLSPTARVVPIGLERVLLSLDDPHAASDAHSSGPTRTTRDLSSHGCRGVRYWHRCGACPGWRRLWQLAVAPQGWSRFCSDSFVCQREYGLFGY